MIPIIKLVCGERPSTLMLSRGTWIIQGTTSPALRPRNEMVCASYLVTRLGYDATLVLARRSACFSPFLVPSNEDAGQLVCVLA